MRGAQHGEGQRDRVVQHPPLLDGVIGQTVPIQPILQRLRRQTLITQPLRRRGQPRTGPAQQEFPGQSAGHVQQHRTDGQPGQHRVEVNARVDKDQQRPRPCHAFMQAHKRGRASLTDQLALAQRIAERPADQQHPGNAQPFAHPDEVKQMQSRVDGQRRRQKGEQRQIKRHNLPAQKTACSVMRPTPRLMRGCRRTAGNGPVRCRDLARRHRHPPRDQPRLAGATNAAATAAFDHDGMAFSEIEQGCILPCPVERSARAVKADGENRAGGGFTCLGAAVCGPKDSR